MNYYFLYYPAYYEPSLNDFARSFKSLKETIDYLDNYYVQFIAKEFPKYTITQIQDFYNAMEQYKVKYSKDKELMKKKQKEMQKEKEKHPAYIKELDTLKRNISKTQILGPFTIEYIKPYMHNTIPKHKIEVVGFIGKTPDERDALYRQHIKLRDTTPL